MTSKNTNVSIVLQALRGRKLLKIILFYIAVRRSSSFSIVKFRLSFLHGHLKGIVFAPNTGKLFHGVKICCVQKGSQARSFPFTFIFVVETI